MQRLFLPACLTLLLSLPGTASDVSLSLATYLGGSNADDCDDIATDAFGFVYLACHLVSKDFPKTCRPVDTAKTGMDAFICKVNSETGDLVYATRLSGHAWDGATRIEVDKDGQAYVSGFTESQDFPTTTNAIQPVYGGGESDAFFVKLNPEGDILYSTFLGGRGKDQGNGLAINRDGNVYLAGTTWSTDLPGTEASNRPAHGGEGDAFVSMFRLDEPEKLSSIVLGGSGEEKLTGIALDHRGSLFLCGFTHSPNFPVREPFQSRLKGKQDGFLAKLYLPGWKIRFSTYFGGDGDDSAWGVAVDDDGDPHVSGIRGSPDLPTTTGAYQRQHSGGLDAFLVKFHASGRRLLHSTYFGGSKDDSSGYDGGNMVLDSKGNVWLVGMTNSTDLPTVNPIQGSFGGNDLDGFLAVFSPDGSTLRYGTYYGGPGLDALEGVAITTEDAVYATGLTASNNLPTVGRSIQPHNRGGRCDAMLVGFRTVPVAK